MINWQIVGNVRWHDGVHRFQHGWGCGTAVIEAKLLAEKVHSKGKVLFQIFQELTKANDMVN